VWRVDTDGLAFLSLAISDLDPSAQLDRRALPDGQGIRPWRIAFSSSYLADFGAFFTIDSGAVGGFRCDPSPCANGAATYGGATLRSQYFITLEQSAGTSLIWSFKAVNGGVQEESLKTPSPTRSFVAKPRRPGSAPAVLGRRQVVTMTKD
jgi:hypothetical protein